METLDTAIELFRRGKPREGAAMCERLLAMNPRHDGTVSALADMLVSTGEHARAIPWLMKLATWQPGDAAVRRRLGGALLVLDRNDEAIEPLLAAVELEPTNVRAHNNLGQARLRLRHLPEAIASFETALRLDAAYAIAHCNLGLAFNAAGDASRAVECFRRALTLAPTLFDAWVGCGTLLAELDRPEPALHCFTMAVDLKPDDVCARVQRAGVLRRLGRRAEAARDLERVVAADALDGNAWTDLATVLHEMGRFDAAVVACRRALSVNSLDLLPRTRLLARLLPSVPDCASQVEDARTAFDAELAHFETWLGTRTLSLPDAFTLAGQQFFYLSYVDRSNRPLLQRYRSLCAVWVARFAAPLPRHGSGTARTGRFKLGFVSAHVRDHSVFNAMLRGWLQALDRARFELTLFSIGTHRDGCTQLAMDAVDHFVDGRRATADWSREIHTRSVDALIYPEIGMNETTLALASQRLALRQYVSWGHPETSGLPTVDGYLSADLLEPADAEDHYTEPLVRLPNLGVYCEPYSVESIPLDLASLGLGRPGPLFVCAGVPFKYRPEHDGILVDIARRIGHCTFVFFDYEIPDLSRKLQTRLAAAFARGNLDATHYVRWIPWLPREAFFGLLRQAAVYLDTIGFSGFNTLMQAVECGLPCVTYEGRFLRGRLGSGILERLNLAQCIAHTPQEYIDVAVRLAKDSGYRNGIVEQIQRNSPRLYGDRSAVDALAAHLVAARDAGQGRSP